MRTAYVLGGASCLWDDLQICLRDQVVPDGLGLGVRPLHDDEGYIAVNDAGTIFPRDLTAWCTLHRAFLKDWRRRRNLHGYTAPGKLFSTLGPNDKPPPNSTVRYIEPFFEGQTHSGSSGLFAVKVALEELGFGRVILCGVPMMPTPHFFKSSQDHALDNGEYGWRDAESYRQGWLEALPAMKGRVFSMSGWTKELLGAPC